MTSFEVERQRGRLYALGFIPPMAHPSFLPTCPQPECGVKNWPDAKYCRECGTRLYPTEAQIERNRRNHAASS